MVGVLSMSWDSSGVGGGCPFLITEHGETLPRDDRVVGASLHTRLRGAALADFAVKNLGWIEIVTARKAMLVRCRPAVTSDCAFAALLYHVWDNAHETVVLMARQDVWQHIILRNRDIFTRLLGSLIHGARAPGFWSGDRLICRAIDQRASPFGHVAAIARAVGEGAAQLEHVAPTFNQLFRSRWSICEPDAERGHTVVRALGDGYTPFNPRWFAQAKDTSLCAYADEDYGLWVAKTHRTASEQRRAIFDEVDAVVRFPRIGDTRLRYSRMTMPLVRPDGRRLVLSVALSDCAIELRQSLRQIAR